MNCQYCGKEINENERFCSSCGKEITLDSVNNDELQVDLAEASEISNKKPLGMKWYKFTVNFQLFAGALLCIGNAYNYAYSGMAYGGIQQAEAVYALIHQLRIADLAVAAANVFLCIFMFITRQKLAKYKKCGPKMYIISLLFNMLISLIYGIAFYSILRTVDPNGEFFNVSLLQPILTVIPSLILVLLNIIYYKKRMHLFVN